MCIKGMYGDFVRSRKGFMGMNVYGAYVVPALGLYMVDAGIV